MDGQVSNYKTNGEIPNDGRSRTNDGLSRTKRLTIPTHGPKLLKIKGTKPLKITYQTMDDTKRWNKRTISKQWTIKYQTMEPFIYLLLTTHENR